MNRKKDDIYIQGEKIRTPSFELMLPDEMEQMFHELHMHQIDSEKQADGLHQTCLEAGIL